MGGEVPSKSQQSAALRNAVYEKYELLQKAQVGYEEALAIARDTELSPDRLLAIRQQGREYAHAVTRYSEAVMAWVSFMDIYRREITKSALKATTDS